MEYICIVLDVGSHMFNGAQKEVSGTLAFKVVESLIHKKLFSESKDEIALIFTGTLNTNNSVYKCDSNSFKHISVVRELGKMDWDFIKQLKTDITSCNVNESDLLEAVYVAADHLVSKVRGRRITGNKRIILFSNLDCEIDLSNTESIESGLNNEKIELSIVSDRALSEVHQLDTQTDKGTVKKDYQNISQLQWNNERELLKLVQGSNGVCFSFRKVLSDLDLFQNKSVSQRGWKVNLEFSDLFSLSVVGYAKVKQVKLPSLKKNVNWNNPDKASAGSGDTTTGTLNSSSMDLDADTESNATIKGYRYGKSIVPWTKEDTDSVKLQVEKSLKMIGFTEEENVPKTLMVGDSATVFVVDNQAHATAFTSLVYAMYASQVVALVRKVYSKASTPRLGALIPRIKTDHVSLVYVELAFGEDIRHFSFPKLPGDNSFSSEELGAIDNLIDRMMLVESQPNGDMVELLKPSHVRNPTIQYFYQCAQSRCFHPEAPLPDPTPEILTLLKPPFDKLDDIQGVIDVIGTRFPLVEKPINVGKKPAGKSFTEDEPTKKIKLEDGPGKQLDLSDMLEKPVLEVGAVDPIGDCKQLLRRGDDPFFAMRGLGDRVWQLVTDSYMDTSYPRALMCLHALRSLSIEHSSARTDLVGPFNEFLIEMKARLHTTPAKKDFWSSIVHGDINLVALHESPFSTITDLEVDKFLVDEPPPLALADMLNDDELDDLFDDM